MTADPCRRWRELLGAHAFGRLEDEERAGLDAHLEGCPECRAERDLLAPVATLLPLADPEWLEPTPAPPASLRRRIVRRVESERRARRRKRLVTGFGLGAAATAAAAVLAVVFVGGSSPAPPGTQVAFTGLPHGVRIGAHIEPRPYGSEVDVYVHGMRRGTRCEVFMRGAHGERTDAGSFHYSYQGDAGSGLSTAMPLHEARAIGIRAGHRTFVAPIPSGSA